MNKHNLVILGSRMLDLHYGQINLTDVQPVKAHIPMPVDIGDFKTLTEYTGMKMQDLWYLFDPEYYRPEDQKDPHVIGMRILNYVACNGKYIDPRSYFRRAA